MNRGWNERPQGLGYGGAGPGGHSAAGTVTGAPSQPEAPVVPSDYEGDWPLPSRDKNYLVFCCVLVLAAPFYWVERYDLEGAYFLPLLVMAVLCCIPFFALMITNQGPLINPGTLFAATFFVNYGFSAIDNLEVTFAGLYLPHYLPRSLIWATAGLAAYLFGYYLPLGRVLSNVAPPFKLSGGVRAARRLWGVVIAAMVLYFSLKFVGLGYFFRFMSGFDFLGVALIGVIAFHPNRPAEGVGSKPWHAIVVAVLTALPALLSGFRGQFVLPFLVLLAAVYFARRSFPWLVFFGALLLAIFVVIPTLSFYKTARQGEKMSVSESIDYTIVSLVETDVFDYFAESSEDVINRFGTMPVFTVIVERTGPGEDVAYLRGLTYRNFFIAFIPRFLWPGKPVMNRFSNWLSREYRIIGKNDLHTSVGLGLMGEAWANFGAWGMLVVMALYGVFYRFIFEWLLIRQDFSVVSLAVFVAILYQLGMQENVFINNITAIIKVLALTWIMLMIAKVDTR